MLATTLALFACGSKGPLPPPDTIPPTVSFTIPANGSVNIPVNLSGITITFSEAMDRSTINDQTITLVDPSVSGTVPCSVTITDLAGTTVDLLPSVGLNPTTLYSIVVGAGVKDSYGNAMSAPFTASFYTSTVADTIPPVIAVNYPETGATGVPENSSPSVTFSEPVIPQTISFVLTLGTTTIPGTVSYSGTTAVFTPTNILVAHALYTARIAGGPNGVRDLAGNTMSADHTWTFTTAQDAAPPSVTATNPAAGGSNVGVNAAISTTFSEPVDQASIAFSLSAGGIPVSCNQSYSGTTAIFSPQNMLAYSTQYTATVSAGLRDLAGNAMTADYSWKFTTGTASTYTITATAGMNGSISPSGPVTVNYGAAQSFTISPAAGYHVADVLADGVSIGAVTSYTFTNVNANHTLSASFAINTYTVTPSAGTHGTISPNAPQTVNFNDTTSFTVTPSAGYYAVMGGTCGGTLNGNTYTTNAVTGNCTVTATFAIASFTVTLSAGPNGGISPDTPQQVSYNDTKKFTITPNTGYSIAAVTGCGGTLTGDSYTTGPITADCMVTATFASTSFTVTPSAGPNGGIIPNTPQPVSYNGTTSFTVTPNTGYGIAEVKGCGGTLTGDSYTTGPITANCTVTATFAIASFTVTPSAGPNGGISPDTPQQVSYNGTKKFTITPNTGYSIAEVTGCGGTLTGDNYTTGPITANCTVTAAFATATFTVTPSAGPNGGISPDTPQPVSYNGTTSFTITPNTGYGIADVKGCGGTLTGDSYTTGPITADCTVTATFAIATFTVTPLAGPNGGISPHTPQPVSYNDTKTFTVTPDTGYRIETVTGCGGTLTGDSYTTGSITADCTVTAAFTAIL